MFLLLDHIIYNSFTTIKFLITDPSNIRTYIILLVYLIEEDNENLFYNNTIIKYMTCPILLNLIILLISNILKNR